MTKFAFFLTSLTLFGSNSILADTVVVFNEIMYHPAADEPTMEWIELHNQHAVDVDLTGWSITGGVSYSFPSNTVMHGNSFLVVAASPTSLAAATGLTNVLGPFAGRLSNNGDTIRLRNNNGRVMDEVSYGVEDDWPVAPDGSGVSLAKIDRTTASGPAQNWTSSEQIGGTPGRDNFPSQSGFIAPAGLVSYWNFNEASGLALDQSSVNHGTLGTGVTRNSGVAIGGSLSFNGTTNAYVNVGAANNFSVTAGITIEAVLLPGWSSSNAAVIFRKAIRAPLSYRDAVMTNQPLAYWRLNDSTTNILDSTANARNGTASAGMLLNQPSLIPSDPGNGAVRGSGGERITINGFEKIGPAGYTVEFWIKPYQLPTGCCQCIVGDGESAGDYFEMNYINGPQQGLVGAIRQHFGPNNSPVSADALTALQVGNVYHIVTTWNTAISVNNALIYINGVADRTSTTTLNVPAAGGTGNNRVYIGHDDREVGDGSYAYDEVALYNYPLTAADVAAHYTAATVTNFSVNLGNAIQLAFQNDTNNAQANPPVADGPVLSFGLTVGGVYSELDMPLDGQSGRPALADLENGQKHHLAATYDSISGLKAIWVDGVIRFSNILSGTINAANNANAILGNSEVNGGAPFVGTLDEMAFWSRALSTTEVATHSSRMQAGRDYFSSTAAAATTLVFNEVSSSTNTQFWLELVNYGTNTLALDGCVIVRDGATNNEYVFPAATSLAAGTYLAVNNTTLGFFPDSGDKLYLLPADRSKVLDSVVVKKRDRARFPEITGPWLYPSALTPGGTNTFAFHNEIVINEIMYHHAALPGPTSNSPPQASKEAWIELFNRSSNSVDLTGWELDGGISYLFAPNTTIPSGGYLVVAKDTNALHALYPSINLVGNFDKQLSHFSDRILLKDPSGNPANQVRYYGAGRWPEYADGGGSSLELRDPNADNSRPEAWAPSIESGKPGFGWSNYSYRAVAQNVIGPQQWNDFVFGLLSSGECLIDDISVIESPTTAPVELIANGNFESGMTGWRVIGDHRGSRLQVDPDNPLNLCLHVVATGPQEHMHNHIETTYAGGRSVVNGREYQISFRAKWLAGNNLLNTRLYFDRVARTTALPMPSRNGTPGAQNSRYETNIGPTFTQFGHRPVIPQAGEAVTVSVLPQDPQGIASAQVWWSVNGGAWNNAAMNAASTGLYTGTIPGLSAGATVQFYVRALDGLGTASTYPANGSNSAALYTVNDGQANLPLAHNVRIILTPANTALLHAFTNVMSNENLPCTVIYDEKRAYYDMGVRLKGSERGRYSDTRVSFHLEFQPDDLFRGVHPVMLIDRSGAGDSTANKQQEIVIRHILWHAGDIPGPQADICRVIAPTNTHTGPAIFSPRHEDEFIATAYDNGSEGTLYELELIYYPTSTNSAGYKNPQPDSVTGVDISDLDPSSPSSSSSIKELYRYDFIIKNHRDADDYSPFIAFAKTFSLAGTTSGSPLDTQTRPVMDINQWMRAFAMITLCGVGDSYTFGNNHNLLMYVRPSDGKMLAFPWDMDFSFNRASNAPLVGDQNLSRIINLPANLRCFYAHILDIIASTYNTTYMTYWANHYDDFCPGQSFSGVPAYIQARATYAIGVISGAGGNVPFTVNVPGGGSDITTTSNLLTLTGTAPVEVKTIEINGVAWPVTWTSLNAWTLRVSVPAATNTLVFRAYDVHGNLLPADAATNTVYYTGTVVDPRNALVINEIMYNPAVSNASYVEIYNNSTNFAFDLSDWRVSGIDYTFPDGTIITNKQFILLAKDRTAFASAYGTNVTVFDVFDGKLQLDGEKLALIKPGATSDQDQVIDVVRYESATPWPGVTNASLQLIDAAQDNSRVSDWSDGSGWRFHTVTAVPGAVANSFTLNMDSAGDFYIDDISLVAGGVPAVGDNLIQNGGFESGSVDPWAALGNHANSVLSTTVKHSGNASLHVISTGAGSSPANTLSNFLSSAVTASGTYTLSFWYLPSANANNLNYRLTSNFRTGVNPPSAIPLKPSFSSPGAPNTTTAFVEPYPLLWFNEVQPNNVSGITDSASQHDPWVEIYNSGTNSITLDAFALANNYTNLAQWTFPNGTVIGPGEFKVIFADSQTGQSSGSELHTNFRLDPTNGSIVLSKVGQGSALRILDYINYTNMEPDFSYGSFPDAQVVDRQRFFYTTPGATNNGAPVPVIINEWLASNTGDLVDPANGKFEDWIELYNFGPTTIDLSGYYMTDNLGQKKTWQIPSGTTIASHGFLLVWADNEATNSTPASLHANFQLKKDGEEIGLFTPDGLTVDALAFGPQQNNISQGRYPDGNFLGVLYFMTTTTPFATNVIPVNQAAPMLPTINDRTINERTSLTFTNHATDADVPTQTLTYSMDAGAPLGASLNPRTGVFSWTPTEAQGGATYPITIRVSDNGAPTMTDSKTFNITVNKVNSPPDVPTLSSRTIPENVPFTLTVAASDSDLPAQQLTFSLSGAPTGASIDPNTGVFSWTPSETQGPSTNSMLVRVTDNGSPNLTTTQALTIVVTEVNSAPVLTNPGAITIDELKGYTNFLVATDSDIPTNSLSFGFVAPFVGGAQLNSLTGRFTWTPTEAQGPSNYVVTVRVFDNGTPSLSVTQSFTITVNEVNAAPVLTNLNNSIRTNAELTSIILTNIATDSDVPTNILTYEIVSAPGGASVNATNGIFTWTPDESQGPSSNNIAVRVYDNGVPSLSATQRFSIIVTEVNAAPILSPISDKTASPGQLLIFTNVVNDPDLPPQVLTFSLGPGAPTGVNLDPATGVFTWTPDQSQSPSTNNLTVLVVDDGTPSLSATQGFKVIVGPPGIHITDIHVVNATQLSITWDSTSGHLQYRDDWTDPNPQTAWTDVQGAQITMGASSQTAIITRPPSQRFYQIKQ